MSGKNWLWANIAVVSHFW